MQTQTLPAIVIQKSSLSEFADEPVKSAKLFHLIYIADASNGITRTKSGNNFEVVDCTLGAGGSPGFGATTLPGLSRFSAASVAVA